MNNKTHTVVSTDTLITKIGLLRDSRIHELLTEDEKLMQFLDKHCDVIAISPVRKEFLKRDLLELKDSKLNLTHYSTLLNESKLSGTIRPEFMEELFVREFQLIFDKYKF
jgi:hypothetical protein